MPYALMSSGGKDAALALDRARRDQLDVRYQVCIYDGTTNRVRFHGVRRDLVEQQARSLGLQPVTAHTTPHGFETVFLETLETLKRFDVTGVVFGNIHLRDVRAWYEDRVTGAGLEHVEPIWGEPSIEVAWEVVERGYQAIVVSVDLSQKAAGFLGRELDADLVTEIGCTDNLDPCGERGEYHTFVFDGPELSQPIDFSLGEILEIEGHRFIDLIPPSAGPGCD